MPRALTEIKGIGQATAERLAAHGFASVEAIAEATTLTLTGVPGFGAARADTVRTAAAELLGASSVKEPGKGQRKSKRSGKRKKKKDKKGKKGRKDKKEKEGKAKSGGKGKGKKHRKGSKKKKNKKKNKKKK